MYKTTFFYFIFNGGIQFKWTVNWMVTKILGLCAFLAIFPYISWLNINGQRISWIFEEKKNSSILRNILQKKCWWLLKIDKKLPLMTCPNVQGYPKIMRIQRRVSSYLSSLLFLNCVYCNSWVTVATLTI